MDENNYTTTGIISPKKLQELIGKVKILDATFVLPGASSDPKSEFQKARIGNAQFFDLKEFSDQTSPLPHMLPTPEDFAKKIAALGISKDDLVVIYAQHGMVMGPARAWWMFRVFGHDNVCVLDGGLPAWLNEGLPMQTGAVEKPTTGIFQSTFRPALVLDMNQMEKLSSERSAHILDARSSERFKGSSPEPRPGLRAGHIPNSVNLPYAQLIDAKDQIKPKSEIEAILNAQRIDKTKPVVTTCGSGVTASFLALVLFGMGQKNIPVYDGSWSEWGLETSGKPTVSG